MDKNKQLMLEKAWDDDNTSIHPLLRRPVIADLICQLQPELLNNTPGARSTLDIIAPYLKNKRQSLPEELEVLLNEEMAIALYGLKIMLNNCNLDILEWTLEETQR